LRATVLIVDDDESTVKGLATLLAQEGYRVLTATTFEAAQFALQTGYPDLVLTDIRLGEFNGLQLIALATDRMPAVVMTGYDDVALENEARRLGAEYLVKPIPPGVLLSAIRRQLSISR
jgi:DNA-binding response OmpR family regulator